MAEIKFSRHAKRRGDLYGISESLVLAIIGEKELSAGVHEIVKNVEGFTYPLKVVVAVENDIMTIITTYPLKKGRRP
jgi:hypothetical protein